MCIALDGLQCIYMVYIHVRKQLIKKYLHVLHLWTLHHLCCLQRNEYTMKVLLLALVVM